MSAPFQVIVHPRIPSLSDPHRFLQAYQRGDRNAPNALIFLGGLTSGPHTTDLDFLTHALLEQYPALGYSLWELRTRSAYTGFGHSSLANDAEDVTDLVRYLRIPTNIPTGKIVLMGASTGSQACLQHSKTNTQPDGLGVDGYILTSPVSDREFAPLIMTPDTLAESLRLARQMIADGKGQESMPHALMPFVFADVPVSAYRWWSLADEGGDDDFFSSDLPDAHLATTFGRVDTPLLILPAGEDELVPATVDREELMGRWVAACREGVVSELSGFIPGAGHEVVDGKAREWLVERVMRFLKGLL
ncbi:hypothetical protein B0T18DRAFT_153136 [Schizothecium vesticola]|uniref:DUF1749-domain-containing protein n=1 Tax=Schizothecium vesticola TaxID=314040 RepID=A0AA40EVS7_9PEZI|nr:hypothetical protein B0T18DRAFT_153136 [Schizothecium vesticola]